MRQTGYDMLRCVALSYMHDVSVHFSVHSTSYVHILVLGVSVLEVDGCKRSWFYPFTLL